MAKSKLEFHWPTLSEIFQRIKKMTYGEIFIVVSVIAITVFIVKFFGMKETWRTIKVEVVRKPWDEGFNPEEYRAPFWMSDKIKVGQIDRNKSGKIMAEIVSIENYERKTEEADVFLTIKIRSVFNKRDKTYLYKNKYYVNIGETIDFNFNNISLRGKIIDNEVPEKGYPTKTFTIKVLGRYLEEWYIKNIIPGDKMINRATGETVAEIISVKTFPSRVEKQFTPSGSLIKWVTYDATLKDVEIVLKVNTYQIDNRWYFTGYQNIKLSNNFDFYTDKMNFYDYAITEISE